MVDWDPAFWNQLESIYWGSKFFELIVNCGTRSTTFQRHFFRVLARDLKPGAHMGALDVLSVSVMAPLFASFQW